jgi:hypothetical protein
MVLGPHGHPTSLIDDDDEVGRLVDERDRAVDGARGTGGIGECCNGESEDVRAHQGPPFALHCFDGSMVTRRL